MNYRVFHTHSSCVHDWEFDFSGVLSINKQGYGLIPNLGALPACVRNQLCRAPPLHAHDTSRA